MEGQNYLTNERNSERSTDWVHQNPILFRGAASTAKNQPSTNYIKKTKPISKNNIF
jgi:hypothetical protein